jgi:hypothetical protein
MGLVGIPKKEELKARVMRPKHLSGKLTDSASADPQDLERNGMFVYWVGGGEAQGTEFIPEIKGL